MIDKRRLRRLYKLVGSISYWWFVAACLAACLTALLALRHNNQTMVSLRDEVFRADQTNGDIEGALKRLRKHVHSHMNTNLASGPNPVRPPIQLKHHYERLVAAERERVAAINSNLYTEGQAVCEKRFPDGLRDSGRIPCIKEYVDARSTAERPIPDSLYKFDFVSPRWSPDLAGWSIVVAIVSAVLFVNRLVAEVWLRHELHKHL